MTQYLLSQIPNGNALGNADLVNTRTGLIVDFMYFMCNCIRQLDKYFGLKLAAYYLGTYITIVYSFMKYKNTTSCDS